MMIDQKIIDLHQWIVDESERKPAWWVEQTAWAFIAAEIAADALNWVGGWDALTLVLGLVIGTMRIITARYPALLASSKETDCGLRISWLALGACDLITLIIHPSVGRLAHLVANLLLISSNYFAACKPPGPRRRRQAAVHGAA